jgi:hypothetical protein
MVYNPQRCSLKFEKDALLSLHANILLNMWGFHEYEQVIFIFFD